jgi:hypothetical protein
MVAMTHINVMCIRTVSVLSLLTCVAIYQYDSLTVLISHNNYQFLRTTTSNSCAQSHIVTSYNEILIKTSYLNVDVIFVFTNANLAIRSICYKDNLSHNYENQL